MGIAMTLDFALNVAMSCRRLLIILSRLFSILPEGGSTEFAKEPFFMLIVVTLRTFTSDRGTAEIAEFTLVVVYHIE